jgi:hypothetical protein
MTTINFTLKSYYIYKCNDIPVTGRGDAQGCEMSRIPHFLGNRLADGGDVVRLKLIFFLIGIVEGGVQLGPLGTAATNRPIVPASGDYDDGEIRGMIGRGNRSTRRKPAPVPLCPPQTPHAARTRTLAAAVGIQRLTACATARPKLSA